MGVGGQYHAPPPYLQERDPLPIIQEAVWAPGLVWMSAENPAPPEFSLWTIQPVMSWEPTV